jgi:Phage integrase family
LNIFLTPMIALLLELCYHKSNSWSGTGFGGQVTFATRLAQAGIDLYMISKLLGHKDIKMTQRYSHHCPDSLRSGVEVLDRISTELAQSNEKGLAVLS